MQLQPIYDNVVIKLPKQEKEVTTASGIVLATKRVESQMRSDQGEVFAVGEGRITSDGTIIPLKVSVGDNVLFNRFAGTEIEIGEDKYLILKECDILMIMK